jgi:5-methylcytosine-specific restriction endonuclease McrA
MPRKPDPREVYSHRRATLRRAVLQQEDLCALCGQPVDKSLHRWDDGAPEVDEIVPVSRGGDPYDRDNVRLTHRICNRRRGNGTNQATTTLPLPLSQQW